MREPARGLASRSLRNDASAVSVTIASALLALAYEAVMTHDAVAYEAMVRTATLEPPSWAPNGTLGASLGSQGALLIGAGAAPPAAWALLPPGVPPHAAAALLLLALPALTLLTGLSGGATWAVAMGGRELLLLAGA